MKKGLVAKELLVALFILICSVSLCLFLSGCAKARLERVMPDGTIFRGEYIRWFNQNIDGFSMESPEGYKLSFDHQKSDTQLLLEYMGAAIAVE